MKVFSLGLNVLTGGAWGMARWFFGLFRSKDGKRTFLGAVMIWLVGHSLFSMMTGAISPWAILRGIGYVLATMLTAGGYEVKPPQDERTAMKRAQDAIDERFHRITEAAAKQEKALEEKARKYKEEADSKIEEMKRNHELDKAKRDLAEQAKRLEQEVEREKERFKREAEQTRQLAERQAQERADKAIREAQAATEDAKRKSAELVEKAKDKTSQAMFGSVLSWPKAEAPPTLYCPKCNRDKYVDKVERTCYSCGYYHGPAK